MKTRLRSNISVHLVCILLLLLQLSVIATPGAFGATGTTSIFPPMVNQFRVGIADHAQEVQFAVWEQGGLYHGDGKKIVDLAPGALYVIDSGSLVMPGSGERIAIPTDERVYASAPDFRIHINGAWYRGVLELINFGDRVTAINLLDGEGYMLGLVSAVVPSQLSIEALKASAVVLRTQAHQKTGEASPHVEDGYDVSVSEPGLPYGGLEQENQATFLAVQATMGLCLQGITQLPPLKYSKSKRPNLGAKTKDVSKTVIEAVTGISDVQRIEVSTWDSEGNAHALTVVGSKNRRQVSGVDLAKRINLPSSGIIEVRPNGAQWQFVCRMHRTNGGTLDLVGADLLAQGGWRFDQILQHYYASDAGTVKVGYLPGYEDFARLRTASSTTGVPPVAASVTPPVVPNLPDVGTRRPPSPFRDKWALVIGVSKFKDPTLDLKYPAKDASDFAQFLVREEGFKSDQVKVLSDAQATRENILAQLGEAWLRDRAKPDDLVVLYMSTHGTTLKRSVSGVNFILPHDVDPTNILGHGIPMEWLCELVKDYVAANRVVIFLDVCHAESATQSVASNTMSPTTIADLGADAGTKGLTRIATFDAVQVPIAKGQVIIASSRADQVSWESKRYQNSVFTKHLMEGLRLHGADTTLAAAFAYLRDNVQKESLQDHGEMQTPVMRTSLLREDIALGGPSDFKASIEAQSVLPFRVCADRVRTSH